VEECKSPGKKTQISKMLLEAFGISQRTMQRKIGVALKKRHNIISSPVSKDVFKIP
jgi:hypothetical protein